MQWPQLPAGRLAKIRSFGCFFETPILEAKVHVRDNPSPSSVVQRKAAEGAEFGHARTNGLIFVMSYVSFRY
jgi:hypothetical protein